VNDDVKFTVVPDVEKASQSAFVSSQRGVAFEFKEDAGAQTPDSNKLVIGRLLVYSQEPHGEFLK
jgi:hypothetical protein